jgi:hypothetical protein
MLLIEVRRATARPECKRNPACHPCTMQIKKESRSDLVLHVEWANIVQARSLRSGLTCERHLARPNGALQGAFRALWG